MSPHARLRSWWPWLAAYAAVMTLVTLGLFAARRAAIATLDNPQARAEWQAWKKAAEQAANAPGPVKRRPPKSAEPPALVLMRDHFGAVLGAGLTIGSCLYAFLAIALRGAARSRATR